LEKRTGRCWLALATYNCRLLMETDTACTAELKFTNRGSNTSPYSREGKREKVILFNLWSTYSLRIPESH
jgi:hypothetical protein